MDQISWIVIISVSVASFAMWMTAVHRETQRRDLDDHQTDRKIAAHSDI